MNNLEGYTLEEHNILLEGNTVVVHCMVGGHNLLQNILEDYNSDFGECFLIHVFLVLCVRRSYYHFLPYLEFVPLSSYLDIVLSYHYNLPLLESWRPQI